MAARRPATNRGGGRRVARPVGEEVLGTGEGGEGRVLGRSSRGSMFECDLGPCRNGGRISGAGPARIADAPAGHGIGLADAVHSQGPVRGDRGANLAQGWRRSRRRSGARRRHPPVPRHAPWPARRTSARARRDLGGGVDGGRRGWRGEFEVQPLGSGRDSRPRAAAGVDLASPFSAAARARITGLGPPAKVATMSGIQETPVGAGISTLVARIERGDEGVVEPPSCRPRRR